MIESCGKFSLIHIAISKYSPLLASATCMSTGSPNECAEDVPGLDSKYPMLILSLGYSASNGSKQLTARTDGSETPIDLSNIYEGNLLEQRTGASLLNFIDKDFNMQTLVRERGLPVTIFQELPDIDLRTEKTNMIGELSDDTATGFPEISSINISNPYMEQTPTKFGFADIIYS
mgnify:CR=1 FL=1